MWVEGEVAVPVDKMVLPWDLKAAAVPLSLFLGISWPQVPLLALQTSRHRLLAFGLLSQLLCVTQ